MKNITGSVKSLNVVIGQIGGYTALLWMVINFLFDGYETFKFTNSLIGRVYASTASGPEAEASRSPGEAKSQLIETLTI